MVTTRPLVFDVPTITAIGAVSGLLMFVTHEVLGHSLVTVLLGAHLVHLSNIDSSYGGPASPTVMRMIAAAGITANIVVGCAVLWAVRLVPVGSFSLRFFAWVFGHATIFMGSSYLAGSAFLPVGDVHAAIEGLPFPLLWQVVLFLVGIEIYRAALRDAGHTLGRWVEAEDRSRLSSLTRAPYLAMGITGTLAGLLNPHGALYGGLWGAAATFGASSGLLFATDQDGAIVEREEFEVTRGGAWIAAGAASTVVLFVVLGPGVPR